MGTKKLKSINTEKDLRNLIAGEIEKFIDYWTSDSYDREKMNKALDYFYKEDLMERYFDDSEKIKLD